MNNLSMFTRNNIVYSYTMEQAIKDGILVDVTSMAKEAGIKFQVTVTREVWEGYIVPDESSRSYGQSESGRLWDILWTFKKEAARVKGSAMEFQVYLVISERRKSLIDFKAVAGPGDNGDPVITIMLPHEN